MKQNSLLKVCLLIAASAPLAACGAKAQTDPAAGAPPPAQVEKETNLDVFRVEHPDQFPLATATDHTCAPDLNVTGAVNVDVSRAIPVISIASGRIVEIHARVGDTVTKTRCIAMRSRSTRAMAPALRRN